MLESVVIFAVAMAGALLPLLLRWTDRLLHSALALATGIFLGAVFLHMLPSLTPTTSAGTAPTAAVAPGELPAGPSADDEGARDAVTGDAVTGDAVTGDAPTRDAGSGDGHDLHALHDHGAMVTWLFVLLGVLMVYLLEGLVFRSHDHDDLHRHRAVSYASLAGLTVHSLTNGLGLGAALLDADLARPIFLAIVAHKGFETFSLATVFRLAQFRRGWILAVMAAYALVTPVGALLGKSLFADLSPHHTGILVAIAAGTFLYVCLCELLPELFHHKEDSVAKIALLAAGIGIMVVVAEAGA